MGKIVFNDIPSRQITAENLDEKSSDGVEQKIKQKQLTFELAFLSQCQKEGHHYQDVASFIQLRGVQWRMQWLGKARLIVECYGGEKISWNSITTPGQEASYSSEAVHETCGDRHDIEHLLYR